MDYKIRTDLALEVRESFPEDDVEIKGVILTEDIDEENKIRISTVEIKDEVCSGYGQAHRNIYNYRSS